MKQGLIGRALVLGCGLLLLVLAALLVPAGAPAYAQDLPPRPTLQPSDSDDGDDKEDQATGRITGTVIDLTTGAPASGVTVMVGEVRVVTDANGNYERTGLTTGNYPIALELNGAGQAAQAIVMVALGPGQTAVQHLAFRSPVATPTPEPTVTVEASTPVEASAPANPALVPTTLPLTAGRPLAVGGLALLGLALIVFGVTFRRRS